MTYFVLPVYNEAENLDRLLASIAGIAAKLGIEYQVIAVDDGSRDDSVIRLESLTKSYPLTTLRHEKNQGPGIAFRTGFNHVLDIAANEDTIITMDADNTHSTNTVGMILAGLEEGYEMVIASVFAPGGMFVGLPFVRYFLTMSCNLLYRLAFPVRGIREYTGFYRGYQVATLRSAKTHFCGELFHAQGFAAMAELLVRLRQIPIFMKEVPMIVRYDQKGGKSKLKILPTITEHLRVIGGNFFKRNVV